MTNDVMAQGYMDLYNKHIIRYTLGGWLEPLTEENKQYFINEPRYAQNRDNATIKNGILTATSNNLAGDCVCSLKSYIDNLVGVDKQTTAMRKPCPDITIKDMLNKQCVDVSTNMDNILIFELMTYADYSHCGVYMGKINGKRMVAEVTYRWDNGLQLIDMDRAERKGLWKYHGKMWNWMDYKFKGDTLFTDVNPAPVPDTTKQDLQACIKTMSKTLDKMQEIVNKMQ